MLPIRCTYQRLALIAGVLAVPLAGAGAAGAFAAGPQPVTPQTAQVRQAHDVDQATTDAVVTFHAAGYSYEDAEALATIWQMSDVVDVKVAAGQKLMDGGELPVPPTAEAPSADELALEAFWNAGYSSEEAEKLAGLWSLDDPADAKVLAGEKLLDGIELPDLQSIGIGGGIDIEDVSEEEAFAAYSRAGYTGEDAVELAAAWAIEDVAEAKTLAGQKLVAGVEVPVAPSGDVTAVDAALEAFIGAGYGADEIEELAAVWQLDDLYEVKVMAGEKLLAGTPLPL